MSKNGKKDEIELLGDEELLEIHEDYEEALEKYEEWRDKKKELEARLEEQTRARGGKELKIDGVRYYIEEKTKEVYDWTNFGLFAVEQGVPLNVFLNSGKPYKSKLRNLAELFEIDLEKFTTEKPYDRFTSESIS